ncbi:phage tail tube protein [Streptomyces sp. NPDC001404]|uniref:phage tail tube protein n=1 Tax=Streptomyces sp. NPDC001404 TaxID=3364571 RepID=UPI0036C6C6D4
MALDAAIGIGAETSYGTPAPTTLGYEGKADSWKVSREYVESVGFRAGMQTARADRRNTINMGGEGELEVDVLDVGASALLSAVFDKITSTADPKTGFTTHVLESSTHSAAPSFTAQMIRPTVDGKTVAFRHVGCQATEFSLEVEVENAAGLTVTFDFQDASHSEKASDFLPIVYPEAARAYDWTRTAVTLTMGGKAVPVDVSKLELTGDLGLKTDRRFLRNTPLKGKPVRAAVPTYEGSLEGEFSSESLKLYDAFLSGDIVGLTVDLVGLTPGTSLKVEAPAIQFTGESPEASPDDITTQNLPYRILDPGTGAPALRATYVEPTPGWTPPGK